MFALTSSLSRDRSVKVGLANVAVSGHNLEVATSFAHELKRQFEQLGLIPVGRPEPILTNEDVEYAARIFDNEKIDLLVVINGTWAPDQFALRLAGVRQVPLVLWSIPEPLTGRFVELASLVGLTQNGGTLGRMGFLPEVVIGPPDDADGLKKLESLARVAMAVRGLRNARIGLVGAGCPGMMDTDFDELTLKKQLGTEVERISVATLARKTKEVTDTEIRQALDTMHEFLPTPPRELASSMSESVRTYLGLRKWVEENELAAIAVRCWPEFKEMGIVSPCLGLALLNESGVPASCEGDLCGALSMLLLYLLSDQTVYLGDLMRVETQEQSIYYFHCGASAPNLATSRDQVTYRTHSFTANWKPGITLEFSIRPGSMTFARIDQLLEGNHRIITYSGEAILCEMVCRGNPMKVRVNRPPVELIQDLVRCGSGHHQLCVHGDYRQEIRQLATFMELKLAELC